MDSALQVLFLIYFNIGYAIANNVDYSNLNMEDVEKVKSITKELGPGYGEDWVYMPNGEGQPVVAYLKRAPVTKIYGFFENNVERGNDFNYEDELNFRLYTKENGLEYQNLSVANPDLLLESAFDPSKVTKLVTHGWNSGASTSTVTKIRDAYLEVEDVNIITIDWKRISDLDYITSSYETEPLGKYTAKLIDQLVDVKGASYSDMHMIGHSLGAHLCGFAGANVKGRLGRITGLDPAMPGFQIFSGDDGRLDKSDADFVDIIHTSAGFLGISISTGHADFYPNGGSLQNGCCCIAEIIDSCSHERSHIYFGESILQPDEFLAVPCDSYAQFKANQCGTDVVPMGEATPTTARGNYYLSTTDNSPYGLGENGTMYIYYGI